MILARERHRQRGHGLRKKKNRQRREEDKQGREGRGKDAGYSLQTCRPTVTVSQQGTEEWDNNLKMSMLYLLKSFINSKRKSIKSKPNRNKLS